MMLGIKRFLLLFSFIPSVCFGIGLDTKIAWEPWAFNTAVMDFCMPELNKDEWLGKSRNRAEKEDLGVIGNISMLITNKNTTEIERKNVKFMPKCAAFIDKYIDQTKKNSKVSLNQIISMCLDTIQDRLICENIALVLVNLTEDRKVLKNYDPKKMQHKIHNSIAADHKICSADGEFCTTYNLVADRNIVEDLVDGDAIYKKSDNQIIGICAGVDYQDIKYIAYIHDSMRCKSTNPEYQLYEFDIQDLSENSIVLIYTDYGKLNEELKQGLQIIGTWLTDLEKCVSKKQVSFETNRALNADYAILGLDLCERDNSTADAIMVCKTSVLKKYHQDIVKNVQELTFEKAENKLNRYKSMYYDYFLSTMTLQHQTDLVLTECEKN